MRFQRFKPERGVHLANLLLQNVIVGCTLAGNRQLLNVSRLRQQEPPRGIFMHDWWLALIASAFGKLTYNANKTILYRQHEANSLGAPGASARRYVRAALTQHPLEKARRYLGRVVRQAESFSHFFREQLSSEQASLVSRVADIRNGNVALNLIRCYLSGIRMQSIERDVALLLANSWGNSLLREER
jgi:rhamnosyltransferase